MEDNSGSSCLGSGTTTTPPPPPSGRVNNENPAPARLERASGASTQVSRVPGAYAHGGGGGGGTAPSTSSQRSQQQAPAPAVVESDNNISLGQSVNDAAELLEDPELAVAMEIDESSRHFDMQRADEMDSATPLHQKSQRQGILTYGIGGCVLLAVLVGIVVAVVLTTSSAESASTAGEGSTGTSTVEYPDVLGDMEHVKDLYDGQPISTQENVLDRTTPQDKAWEWLQQHPNITSIPDWKKQQLFAIYFFSKK